MFYDGLELFQKGGIFMEVTANGISLFYEVSGSGEPMILLHGNGEDHHIFDALAAKLSAKFTVYAVDSRNHGQSRKTDDYSYAVMSEDVYAFIRALRLKDVNLIGFSDGAIISLLLAMRHEDIIKKMALLGVNLKPEDFTEEAYRFIKETYEETNDPLFKLMLEQPDIQLEDVRKVGTPALVVAAEHDIYRPETFAALTEALPDAEMLVMAGHEHDSYIVNQDILYPDLIRFFNFQENDPQIPRIRRKIE
jgi:pimeloyl-ACP methyl ester carboxylesterase